MKTNTGADEFKDLPTLKEKGQAGLQHVRKVLHKAYGDDIEFVCYIYKPKVGLFGGALMKPEHLDIIRHQLEVGELPDGLKGYSEFGDVDEI